MTRHALALAALLLSLGPASALAQQSEVQFITARFERYVDALRRQAGIPGLSGAIIQDGQIVWEAGFGFEDVERSVPASPDTIHYIGDLTQIFTATMTLQCVEHGTLQLNRPVRLTIDDGTIVSTTVGRILTHTSSSADGSVFQYEPARFTRLGAVLETCGEDDFRQRLAHTILDRLGMSRSVAGFDAIAADPLDIEHRNVERQALLLQAAKPYRVDRRGRPAVSSYADPGINASVGLLSTVRDLARFDAALDQNVLLTEETRLAAWTPTYTPAGQALPFGLGWFVQSYLGQPVVWHFSYVPNASSALYLKLPQRGLTLILLANSDGLSNSFPLPTGDVTASPFARVFLTLFG